MTSHFTRRLHRQRISKLTANMECLIKGMNSANKKMTLLNLFLIIFATKLENSIQLTMSDCGLEYRHPEYTDISVECGTEYIGLAIKFCPVMYSGYNETLLILNKIMNNPACQATLDATASPPVARFRFPLNTTNACGSNFVTIRSIGTGAFSDFSNIETVNISGVVRSNDITTGTVTYNAELKYYYSCAYPLEYLVNNTQIDVSGSSIAVKDNNGSFISTLNLQLFTNINYTQPLAMPSLGIELRTNVFVQVEAINLTSQYYVLLDRCYASISRTPTATSFFNLFVPCTRDRFTKMIVNGEMQHAQFSFPAFRFTEQQNQTMSTYFLHCITRLCEKTSCSRFMQCSKRRRRGVVPLTTTSAPNGVTDTTTITSPAIIIRADGVVASKEEGVSITTSKPTDTSVGLGVAVGILALACIMIVGMGTVFYKRYRHTGTSKMPHRG